MIDFIGPISTTRNNIGGATLKNRCLIKELKRNNIKIKTLDTDNWKKIKIKILFNLIYIFLFSKNKKIILSTSSGGTYKFLKLAHYLNIKNKEIYYFVVGGDTPSKIETKQYDIKYYKNLKKIYIETKSMCERMIKQTLKQTEYLPNFKEFEIRNFEERKIKLPLRCIFFSRIIPEKGVNMIFKALKEVNREDIKLNVDFYGPVEKNYNDEFYKRLSLEKNTEYKGVLNIQDKKSYSILEKYDLMLFPTYWEGEGFPGTLIDSFISGIPVLASDWNYNFEILNDKIGYFFGAKNQEEFVEILHNISSDLEGLANKRKQSLEEAKKYHVENVLKKVIEEFLNDSN